jgi:hypothetical protein
MVTIGFRVKPDAVTFVLYDSDARQIINVEDLRIPKALPEPDALKYVRNSVLDVLSEYEVSYAGLRVAESMARRQNVRRIQIEGVIQEAFASSNLKAYYCGQISGISSRIDIPRADFKLYVRGEAQFEQIESWETLAEPAREATFAALGALRA